MYDHLPQKTYPPCVISMKDDSPKVKFSPWNIITARISACQPTRGIVQLFRQLGTSLSLSSKESVFSIAVKRPPRRCHHSIESRAAVQQAVFFLSNLFADAAKMWLVPGSQSISSVALVVGRPSKTEEDSLFLGAKFSARKR